MTLLFLVTVSLVLYYLIIYKDSDYNIFFKKGSKKCPNCGNQIEANYNVCPVCKETLKKKCNNCGKMTDIHWKYCPYCRATLKNGDSDEK